MVCSRPAAPTTTRPRRGRRAATTPSGTARAIAASSDSPTSALCSAARPAIDASACSRGAATRAADARGEEIRGDLALGNAIQLGAGVERDHRRVVDAALQALDRREGGRRARGQIRAVEQDGVVAGEELAVVGQHAQRVGADLGVGRVDVHHVGAAARERAVGEVVVHAARLVGEAVVGAKPGPAVAAVHDLVREHQPQLGMRDEVGDAADAERGRARLGHRQRVAVVEAQRPAHAQAVAGQHVGERPARRPRCAGSPWSASRCIRDRRRRRRSRARGTRPRCRRAAGGARRARRRRARARPPSRPGSPTP